MSSYSTNNNTRRTKRSRLYGTRPENGSDAIASNANKAFEHNASINAGRQQPSLITTQIGSHNSKGLLITGGAARPTFGPEYNPDDRSILLGTSSGATRDDTLANPPYPISFSGPGYLAFQQEIAIPTIRGNLIITGDLKINGNLTYENAGLLGAAPFVPAIQDALGNTLDGITSEGAVYVNQTLLDYFEVKISWTGISSLVPGEALRLVGFPRTDYSIDSSPQMEGEGGVFTEEVNGHFNVQPVDGESYMELQETSYFSGGPPTPLTVANLASSGVVHFAGWMRKAA